jgi:hypothetical protein
MEYQRSIRPELAVCSDSITLVSNVLRFQFLSLRQRGGHDAFRQFDLHTILLNRTRQTDLFRTIGAAR